MSGTNVEIVQVMSSSFILRLKIPSVNMAFTLEGMVWKFIHRSVLTMKLIFDNY